MTLYVLALLIGVVAGLRALMAPAVVSWAIHFGWIDVTGTSAALFGAGAIPYVLSAIALMELVTDQLPNTPSRKAPVQFVARLVSGALCGAVFGLVAQQLSLGAVLGLVGAAIGTLGGYAARTRLARANGGRDRPVALAEDALALLVALLCVNAVS